MYPDKAAPLVNNVSYGRQGGAVSRFAPRHRSHFPGCAGRRLSLTIFRRPLKLRLMAPGRAKNERTLGSAVLHRTVLYSVHNLDRVSESLQFILFCSSPVSAFVQSVASRNFELFLVYILLIQDGGVQCDCSGSVLCQSCDARRRREVRTYTIT